MNGRCRAAPGATERCGGNPESAAAGPRAGHSVFFPTDRRLPAVCRWLARLLAAPLFLLQPAAAQAEAGASEDRTGVVAARTVRATGAADDPNAGRARSGPRPAPPRRGSDSSPTALLPDDNVDDDARDAPALAVPARAPVAASAPAGADAERSRWQGGGIRGPPGLRAPPAPRVQRTALKASRGRDTDRWLSALHNNNNARPSPAATRPARLGTV